MKKINLSGKKALVTGGNQGIGAEICRQLAGCGADVFINYLDHPVRAEMLAEELQQTFQVKTAIGQADVANSAQVKALFERMDELIGTVDILVNNAGLGIVGHVLDIEESVWDRILNVNLKGAFLCSQQAGRRMEHNGGGVIINISSIHDVVPRKGFIHYCSAKAGLRMFSKCLSLELANQNVRVVSIAPGAIETESNREEIATFGKDKFEHWIPQRRIGQVSDIANTVAFVASDLADYMNGTDIYIDGAYRNSTIQYDPRPPRVS